MRSLLEPAECERVLNPHSSGILIVQHHGIAIRVDRRAVSYDMDPDCSQIWWGVGGGGDSAAGSASEQE
jgi:hypothetical protein